MLDIHEIIKSIDGRLAEAREEIASLEAALAAFSQQPRDQAAAPAARRRRSGKAAPPRARRRSKPAKPEVVPAEKLEVLLRSHGDLSTGELAEQTGGDRQQILTLLRQLEEQGQVRRSGERRNTRWHAITDEDRIAARVAELERQRSRAA